MKKEIIYFELNNWHCGRDYPNSEPFISWVGNDFDIYFQVEKWVKENKLCVVVSYIDMSINFCITSTKDWVIDNCPLLLEDYTQFLRLPDEDGDVFGRFGDKFLPYEECNFGIKYVEE